MTSIKELLESIIEASKPKTQAFDTTATVTRVENGIAWVHIPGGVRETPVNLTINAQAGDTVQVRVSGGRAFLVGNESAPPTDDHVATQAVQSIEKTNKVVAVVKEMAERVARIAGNTNQYFWHTETGTDTGAHITEIPQEEFLADPDHGGGNLLARSNGVAVRDGLTELAIFGADGIHLGNGGSSALDATNSGIIGTSNEGMETFKILCGTTDSQKVVSFSSGLIPNEADDKTSFASYRYTPNFAVVNNTEIGVTATAICEKDGVTRSASCTASWTYDTSTLHGSSVSHIVRPFWPKGGLVEVEIGWQTSKTYANISAHSNSNTLNIIGIIVSMNVTTADPVAPSYTFGTRRFDTEYAPYSFAAGENVEASAEASHASGIGTCATNPAQTVIGRYNELDNDGNAGDYLFVVGDGEDDSNRSNAFSVGPGGGIKVNGKYADFPRYLGFTANGTYTLPFERGAYLIVTGHNSTAALNGLWIVRLNNNSVWKLAGGGNVTITASDNKKITVTTTAGTVNVTCIYLGY